MKIVFRKHPYTYGQENQSTEQTIRNTIIPFETLRSLLDNSRPTRFCLARSEENTVAIARHEG